MLFLAVTLGFFVENYREHFIEREREKEFLSLIAKDIQMDIAMVDSNLHYRNIRADISKQFTKNFTDDEYKKLLEKAIKKGAQDGMSAEQFLRVNSSSFKVWVTMAIGLTNSDGTAIFDGEKSPWSVELKSKE